MQPAIVWAYQKLRQLWRGEGEETAVLRSLQPLQAARVGQMRCAADQAARLNEG